MTDEDWSNFNTILANKLDGIIIPDCVSCRDVHCKNPNHIVEIDECALNILGDMDDIVKQIAEKNDQTRKKYKVIPGWNDLVKPFKEDAMFWHSIWISAGKP